MEGKMRQKALKHSTKLISTSYIYIYIYIGKEGNSSICIYLCVCVCVCGQKSDGIEEIWDIKHKTLQQIGFDILFIFHMYVYIYI